MGTPAYLAFSGTILTVLIDGVIKNKEIRAVNIGKEDVVFIV